MEQTTLNSQLFSFAEELLNDDHSIRFSMKGYSMYPTLKPGDIGLVEKCQLEDLKIGDIVVFKSNNILVCHRLIDIINRNREQLFITKGDKNYPKDAPFTSEQFLGKITSFQRKHRILKLNSGSMKMKRFAALHFSKLVIPFYDLTLRLRNGVNTLTTSFRSLKQNLSVVSNHSGKVLFTNIIIAILQGIMPFIIIICIKSLIDFLTGLTIQNESQQIFFITLLVLTGLAFLINGLLSEVKVYFSEKLSQSVTRQIYEKLHIKHSSLDISHYENPGKQDKIHRAVQEASYRPIKILNELLTGIKSVAASLFLVALFVSIKWYFVAMLLIAIIPGVIFRFQFSRKLYKLKEVQSSKEREMYYYNRILTGFPFAKELKLFGFFDFFFHRFSTVQDNLFKQKIRLRKSELWLGIWAQLFSIILVFLSLGYISYLKITGVISIGTVVLFFFAFQRGYSVLNDLFRSLTQVFEDNIFLNDFIAFLNIPTPRLNVSASQHSSFSLEKGIRIENIRFRYESSKRDALKSVNINIPAGKTVAFVGANGSGKSTMIKLLCGFYQPDAGKILYDGIDSTLIGQNTICENITAVFQDFALYNIPAIENLHLGNTQAALDPEKAKKAAQAAGIANVIEQLPNSYNTLLGNLFVNGEELSIGQWQKMAIARAFYRDSSLILMDEPSSALDADSEVQIIDSLKKLSHNKTAVIISHRLTTVQWVDLIYFFQDGEVIESGNHQELMALKGKYYSLFQTSNYRLEEA